MVSDIRYVGGFGRMSWVDRAGYKQAQPDPLASSGEQIIGHMNAEALRIGFRSPQDDSESVRRELITMLAEARV
ncbi:MAG TPA: hypothetical protein VHA57_02895 [Actinomycetota bacterium]|nr:hypothetical protein [Actinomycetota bacterium]